VLVSARTGAGIAELRNLIATELPRPLVEVQVLLPYDRGDLVSRVHSTGEVLEEEHLADGTSLVARVNPDLAAELQAFTTSHV
jgi:GTP-binding protein HflX